jgi:hypothetical protein
MLVLRGLYLKGIEGFVEKSRRSQLQRIYSIYKKLFLTALENFPILKNITSNFYSFKSYI